MDRSERKREKILARFDAHLNLAKLYLFPMPATFPNLFSTNVVQSYQSGCSKFLTDGRSEANYWRVPVFPLQFSRLMSSRCVCTLSTGSSTVKLATIPATPSWSIFQPTTNLLFSSFSFLLLKIFILLPSFLGRLDH